MYQFVNCYRIQKISNGPIIRGTFFEKMQSPDLGALSAEDTIGMFPPLPRL